MTRPLRVAIIGSGPAGIYASDCLMKSAAAQDPGVSIDILERMPAPFGLIRYGVAPDHPRIKGIIANLHKVLNKQQVRFFGNVEFGTDVTLDNLLQYYDAVIFATGAKADRALNIPGIDLDGSYGAAEFVAWYDGQPEFPRQWPLDSEKVAVIGVGNVSLDVSRILAKTADELHVTEIPDNVYECLKASKVKEVHVFGRRGPAQAKYTPVELRELDHSPNVQVLVNPEDIDYDKASEEARRAAKATDMVCTTLENYAMRDEDPNPDICKIYIHLFESPVEILGKDGKVAGIRTERTQLNGKGGVTGTGKTTDWEVGQVYRAVGYLSSELPGIPFNHTLGTIENVAGRVVDQAGDHIAPLYTTGWVKRGPVGLVGNTKSDANETIQNLLEDWAAGKLNQPAHPSPEEARTWLDNLPKKITDWTGWYRLDVHEKKRGAQEGRERKKIVEWDDMVNASHDTSVDEEAEADRKARGGC